MITYGLKLWTNNTDLFQAVRTEYERGSFGMIELYCNPDYPFKEGELVVLRDLPVSIHATHSHGFHEFVIGEKQKEIWQHVVQLADFFSSPSIIVHPGNRHSFESFVENLQRIDDPRILMENMAGIDINGNPLEFAQTIDDLKKIKHLKPFCFDFQKAIKAACYQHIPYKEYISEALEALTPSYFHISGGMSDSPVDGHGNLWDSDFDFRWIRETLQNLGRDSVLVFETPKKDGLANDLKNMQYFRTYEKR